VGVAFRFAVIGAVLGWTRLSLGKVALSRAARPA
jgi:hypothetical protein